MTEFVGRTGAKRNYSYPQTPRGLNAASFARNAAIGPGTDPVDISDAGTQIPWFLIENGATASVNIPITPRATGRMLITGEISIANTAEGALDVQAQIQVDGSTQTFPLLEKITIPIGGFGVIPIVAVPPLMTVGTTKNISILLTASSAGLQLSPESSEINIQEVALATG